MADTMMLVLVGDVNLKRDLQFNEHSLDLVDGELRRADVRMGNLEGMFYDPTLELDYKKGWFHNEPDMVNCLAGRFDAVNCANNVHAYEGIRVSNAHLDRIGVVHAGAGRNYAEAHTPAIFEKGGTRFGLLGYTSLDGVEVATETKPGPARIKGYTSYEPPRSQRPGTPPIVHSWPDRDELAAACDDIRKLRERVDVLVTYFHWGLTNVQETCEYQPIIARAAVDAGADIVVGSHPHTHQGIELYRDAAIFYSLGNFSFGWKLHRQATYEGTLVRVKIRDKKPAAFSVVPVRRNDRDTIELLDPGQGTGKAIFETLARLSKPLGTELSVSGDEILVPYAGSREAAGAALAGAR
ncbi:MAG: CapA family protein [Chloroflexota bacterium]|nr:CapA family protein [Chloroflexota bacterium]